MTTTKLKPTEHMVQSMRQIRDEISNEIKDMSFAEERAFLDKLLTDGNLKVIKELKVK
jgi:hypothetical protein